MARYEKGHKAETHRRIVDIAAQRFRAEGVDAVGVASLMSDAGLTHGGFYAHFASKEALVKEAVLAALASSPAYSEDADAPLDLPAFIDHYLSPAHRDKPGLGCAVATLAAELPRRMRATRTAFAKELNRLMTRIASALPDKGAPEERLALAYRLYGDMSGALQLARVAVDKALSERILKQAREAARALAGCPAQADRPQKTPAPRSRAPRQPAKKPRAARG